MSSYAGLNAYEKDYPATALMCVFGVHYFVFMIKLLSGVLTESYFCVQIK